MKEYIIADDFLSDEDRQSAEAQGYLKELIRCKDCKHYMKDPVGIPYCHLINYGYGYKEDDYCSRAERKEKNGK